MASPISFHRFQTVEQVITRTSGTDPVQIDIMQDTVASSAALPIIVGSRFIAQLGATATNTVELWPSSVAALASGTALHVRIQFTFGSTDTTKSSREVELTATGLAVTTYGRALELDFDAVTLLTLERINTANEICYVEVLWDVYTI